LATAFGAMASPVGCLLSFLMPNAFFISNDDLEWSFKLYLIVQTVIITGLTVPGWFLFRERPPSPPS